MRETIAKIWSRVIGIARSTSPRSTSRLHCIIKPFHHRSPRDRHRKTPRIDSRAMSAIDYATIALYLAVTIALGLHFARRWKGSEDFFLAGRDLTWPLIGLSLFATNISAEPFLGQGGYEWIASYCLIMLAAVFAPQYLKHRVFTIPEFFEKRYGIEARVLLTVSL